MITSVILPQLELTMENVSVVRVLVRDGDLVAADQALLEVETQKAVSEVPAPCAGYVRGLKVKLGDVISEKTFLCFLTTSVDEELPDSIAPGEEPIPRVKGPHHGGLSAEDGASGKGIRATPAARKLARELNVDLSRVPPSGVNQRVEVEDVRAFSAHAVEKEVEGQPGDKAELGWSEFSAPRLALNAQMVRSLAEIPQILVSRHIDVTKLSVRSEGITFTHLLISKVAVALEKHSALRTITDGRRYRVTPVSVAVAMDSPSGLVAPVLRSLDLQSVGSIANRVKDFRRRAEQRALRSEELRDGPFALTNLGMFGVDQFSPFVFFGQTAVLAVGRIALGSSASSRAWFSLASDHRVVDGAEAARFLETLQDLLLT